MDSIHILIVEDDNDINKLLCNIVKRSGYLPQPAFSGTEAMLYLTQKKWNLVLLDLMLPGLSGEEVLAKMGADMSVPVIIISAKSGQKTKVDLLRTGADDYITKPFDIEEVSARIDGILRRSKYAGKDSSADNRLIHKDLSVDLELKRVTVADTDIQLTAREYEILVLLMMSPKKIFTKENLFHSVWNDEFMGDDNTISVHMSNLRSKLAKRNSTEEYIETIWGMGYRLKQ